jgi:hypothetical protein
VVIGGNNRGGKGIVNTPLNRTQESILRLLSIVRYATAEDITHWRFSNGSHTWCRTICTHLAGDGDWQKTGYLVRFLLPTVRGNSTRIFALARAGAKYLGANGVQADWWYRPYRMSNQSFSYLTHHLACTRLYISADLFCRQHPEYQVEQVFMAHDLAKDPPTTRLVINEQETTVTLLPDLWVHLSRSDGQYYGLWIEVDNGTENRGKWQDDLLSARIAFLKQGYAAYFHTPACLLCYVVIGQPPYCARRLRQLQEWTMEVLAAQKREAWQSIFRFAAVDIDAVYTYPQTLFAAPVFYLPDESHTAMPLLDTTPTNQSACTAEKEHTDGEHTHPDKTLARGRRT